MILHKSSLQQISFECDQKPSSAKVIYFLWFRVTLLRNCLVQKSINVIFVRTLHKIKQFLEIYLFNNKATVSRGKTNFFLPDLSKTFVRIYVNTPKPILFLPDRFCYHESSIIYLWSNFSFKAWNHVPKIYIYICLKYSQVFLKDNVHLQKISPFVLCIFWQCKFFSPST